MSDELARRDLLVPASSDWLVSALPKHPERVFALTLDYTALTMEQLESIRTLIGGGNGPVVKLNAQALTDPITRDSALAVLTHAIAIYPHQQLYLLVPWGLAAIDQVIATIDSLAGRGCQPCFIIGDNAYAIEMMFPIEPMSEGDAELRRDPDVIAGSAAFYRPWLGQGR